MQNFAVFQPKCAQIDTQANSHAERLHGKEKYSKIWTCAWAVSMRRRARGRNRCSRASTINLAALPAFIFFFSSNSTAFTSQPTPKAPRKRPKKQEQQQRSKFLIEDRCTQQKSNFEIKRLRIWEWERSTTWNFREPMVEELPLLTRWVRTPYN